MGAGKWWQSFNEFFRSADVVICGDNDQPGRDHVKLVSENLHGVAKRLARAGARKVRIFYFATFRFDPPPRPSAWLSPGKSAAPLV